MESLEINDRQTLQVNMLHDYLNQQKVRKALLLMIILNRLPLHLVETPSFHAYNKTLNPCADNVVPVAHNTIRADIINEFALWKETVKNDLHNKRSNLHVALDIWTSPNRILFIAIVGYYIPQKSNKVIKRLLALKEIVGHAGEEQWVVLKEMLKEFGCLSTLGVVIGDNATTNDKLCRIIGQYMTRELSINWDAETRRIRCMGHIINLIVQAFLFNTKTTGITEEEVEGIEKDDIAQADGIEPVVSNETREQTQRDRREKFRSLGAMGKLHNIVVYIRCSAGQTARWLKLCIRMIPLDNRTRWNSWYLMIKVAVEEESNVDYYVKGTEELSKDTLTREDWVWLKKFKAFFGKFEGFTLQLEGPKHDIARSLPTLVLISMYIKTERLGLEKRAGRRVRTILSLLSLTNSSRLYLRRISLFALMQCLKLSRNGGNFSSIILFIWLHYCFILPIVWKD
jgi:hypothetical protein